MVSFLRPNMIRGYQVSFSVKTAQKSNFYSLTSALVFYFDISKYLRDKYFDIVWKHLPPGTPK